MSANESNWPSWVTKAEHDRLNVRNNLAAEEVPWDTLCFHAQQAAEKMLKALLVFHGVDPRRTHDLLDLLGDCLAVDLGVEELRESCLALNPYSVQVRYPLPYPEPGESEGRAAVEAAERIYAAVLRRLPPLPAKGHPENGE